jgi:ATP-dependent Zn protease
MKHAISPHRLHQESVAYHEVGHAIAARHHEIPFAKMALTIVPGDDYSGRLQIVMRGCHWDVNKSDRARMKTERLVQAYLAGIAAQRHHRPSSVRGYHASEDYRQVNHYINYFVKSQEEHDAYFKLLKIRTQDLFKRPDIWANVEALAAALLERKTLSAKEADEIIQATSARDLGDYYK